MVNQASGTEQLYVEIPPSLKALVDDDDRTNKELVIQALERELNVSSEDSVAIIDRKIKRLEDHLEREKEELERRHESINSVQSDLERYRSIRQEKANESEDYEDALDEILDALESGELGHIFPTHGKLDELRAEFDRPNEEIHLDLKQRAAKQERGLTVADFKQGYSATRADERTLIAESWGESDE